LIVSRAVAFYLLCWVFNELTFVPVRVHEVLYHLGPQTATSAYFLDVYVLGLVFLLVRVAIFSTAAIWFYRCGPGIQAFFLPGAEASDGE
jgi:hypothetical protein